MKKRWWKNGTFKRSVSELGLESEECRSLHACVCVYVLEIFEYHSKLLKSFEITLGFMTEPSIPCSGEANAQY